MTEKDLPAFGRVDWIVEHVSKLPTLIMHMREQTAPSMQGSTDPRVSGTKEQATVPLNLSAVDDADELWGKACTLAANHAHRAEASADSADVGETVERQWLSDTRTVVGFASTDPARVYSDVLVVARYLARCAFSIAINAAYAETIDELVASIKSADARYQGPRHHSPHKHRCPRCLRHAVTPTYSKSGEIQSLTCGHCSASRKF